jgi:hypothetical protein
VGPVDPTQSPFEKGRVASSTSAIATNHPETGLSVDRPRRSEALAETVSAFGRQPIVADRASVVHHLMGSSPEQTGGSGRIEMKADVRWRGSNGIVPIFGDAPAPSRHGGNAPIAAPSHPTWPFNRWSRSLRSGGCSEGSARLSRGQPRLAFVDGCRRQWLADSRHVDRNRASAPHGGDRAAFN